jgi:excisionase family DNA binding protein
MAQRTCSVQPAPRYASLAVAANYAGGCSVRTIRRMISSGEISGYKLGRHLIRVDLNEIDKLLRRIPTAEGGPDAA